LARARGAPHDDRAGSPRRRRVAHRVRRARRLEDDHRPAAREAAPGAVNARPGRATAVVADDDDGALPLEVEDFLTHLAVEKGRSQNTLAAYRRDLRQYLAHLRAQGRSIGDVTPDDVLAYVRALQ